MALLERKTKHAVKFFKKLYTKKKKKKKKIHTQRNKRPDKKNNKKPQNKQTHLHNQAEGNMHYYIKTFLQVATLERAGDKGAGAEQTFPHQLIIKP